VTCHKCRQSAVVVAADGNGYCAYCQRYAPQPIELLIKEGACQLDGALPAAEAAPIGGWLHD
jgi:hypothetical protein